jgi:hypothetical protein
LRSGAIPAWLSEVACALLLRDRPKGGDVLVVPADADVALDCEFHRQDVQAKVVEVEVDGETYLAPVLLCGNKVIRLPDLTTRRGCRVSSVQDGTVLECKRVAEECFAAGVDAATADRNTQDPENKNASVTGPKKESGCPQQESGFGQARLKQKS